MKFKSIDERYVLSTISRLEKGKASGQVIESVTLVQDAAEFMLYPLS